MRNQWQWLLQLSPGGGDCRHCCSLCLVPILTSAHKTRPNSVVGGLTAVLRGYSLCSEWVASASGTARWQRHWGGWDSIESAYPKSCYPGTCKLLVTSSSLFSPLLTITPSSHCCFCGSGITEWCPQVAELLWTLGPSFPSKPEPPTSPESRQKPQRGLLQSCGWVPLICILRAFKAETSSWPLIAQGWKNDLQNEFFSFAMAHRQNDDLDAACNVREAGGDL